MSEINKISGNQPFEVRVSQPRPDPKERRDTTVQEDGSNNARQQASSNQKKNKAPTPQSTAMEEMLDKLREQQLEDDQHEYMDRRAERYRESNRQSSEAYLKNLKEVGKQQTKAALNEQHQVEDTHKQFHSRIQDISRNHIQKILKTRLEDSTFNDLRKIHDGQDAPAKAPLKNPETAGQSQAEQRPVVQMDNSRLRPEISQMLKNAGQADLKDPKAQTADDPDSAAPEAEATEGRSMLEGALSKLRNRLGGAHKGQQAATTSQFSPQLPVDGRHQNPSRPAETPIRMNLGQIQQDMVRSRAIKDSADGTRYVPLQDGDVQKILLEHKLPLDYRLIQSIKTASQAMQDSSYHFQKAVTLLAQIGLEVTPQLTDVVTDALRMYEKYQRQSVMNKLFRYLTTQKYMQLYQKLNQESAQQVRAQRIDIGSALFNPETGQQLEIDHKALQAARSQARPSVMNLPADASPEALKGVIQQQLKELGLPATKVMVRQLVQSAMHQPLRAQALILQLAAGLSLKPEAIEHLLQRLQGLPDAEQRLPPLELMRKLDMPIPEKLLQRQHYKQAEQKDFLKQLGLPQGRLEPYPQSSEAILLIRQLAERTGILQALIPQLRNAIQQRPNFWIEHLGNQTGRLQQMLEQFPRPLEGNPQQQDGFAKALVLALELPPERLRSWERLRRLGQAFGSETPETASKPAANKAPGPEAAGPKAAAGPQAPGTASTAASTAASPNMQPNQQSNVTSTQLLLETALQAQNTARNQQGLTPPIDSSSPPQPPGAAAQPQPNPGTQAPLAQQSPVAQAMPSASSSGPGAQPAATAVSEADAQVLAQYPLPAELQLSPLQRESILLLHLLAERTQTLGQLVPQMNQALQSQPQATLQQLVQLLPHLHQLQSSQHLDAPQLQRLLGQITGLNTGLNTGQPPAEASGASQPRFSPPFEIPSDPIRQTLQRFYPQMAEAQVQAVAQQLQGAAPAQLNGFFQLHRLLGVLDSHKAQSLAHVWSQPRVLERLQQLGPVLEPVLNAVALNPEKQYLTGISLQNQILQGLQSFLQQGRSENLQAALMHWLQPQAWKSPLGKVKDQLQSFGVTGLSNQALEEVWALSRGSQDRIDAMGILLRGGLPLLNHNIQVVLNHIEQLPPQWRQQGVSDILLHLSPELIQRINQQSSSGGILNQLQGLLQHQLPLISENLQRSLPAGPAAVLPALPLNDFSTLLAQLLPQLRGAAHQDMQQLQQGVMQLNQNVLSLTKAPAAALQPLQQVIEQLLQLQPQASLRGQQLPPVQAWTQVLQTAPEVPQVLVQQFQDHFSGLLLQLRQLLPAVQQRLQQQVPVTEAQPQLLSPLPEAQLDDPAMIKAHLQNWGLNIQDGALLQQIQQLMQGSQERLDAMAILLKGNAPLLPAHIAVVAQYVKQLPPQERFRSVSKILLYLSDQLIEHMQSELQQKRQSHQQQLFPGLEPEQAEAATQQLQRQQGPLTETGRQAAQLLSQSPLQQELALPQLQQLLTTRLHPQALMGNLQQLLGQMLSLLPQGPAYQALEPILESLQALQAQLQPKQQHLGSWLTAVGAQLARLSEQLQSQSEALGALPQRQMSAQSSSWLESLLATLLGLSQWMEQEEPQKTQQARKLRQQIQEQLQHFRGSLDALAGFQASESAPPPTQTGAALQQQPLTQLIPAVIEQFGFPVEILIQDERPDPESAGEKQTDIQLLVQTHTLGQVQLSLSFKRSQLQIRIGLEQRETQRWLQPFIKPLLQKLEALPWQLAPIQTYVVPPQQFQAPLLARHLYRRYGQSAIAGL